MVDASAHNQLGRNDAIRMGQLDNRHARFISLANLAHVIVLISSWCAIHMCMYVLGREETAPGFLMLGARTLTRIRTHAHSTRAPTDGRYVWVRAHLMHVHARSPNTLRWG